MRISGVIGVSGVLITILLVTCIIPVNGLNETPLFDLSVDSPNQESSPIGIISTEDEKPRIAVVKPIFTSTAYADAFYEFYRKHARSTEPFITTDLWYLNVTVKDDWGYTAGLADFLYSAKARIVDLYIDENVELINEIDVIKGALFDESRRVYDVLILGFTEYVTIEEYNFYQEFVETGGTLIIMNACNFLAEVKYYPPVTPDDEGHISLVKGHGWEFNGTHAWKSVYHRWPEENRNWVGSNYWRYWWGNHYDSFRANTSHSISTYIRNHYGEDVPTIYRGHEENKLENLTDTQIIGYWNFTDPSEAPD
ncbi:MAG: hypothetical protein ACFFAY_15225, partial [Promethearchaeota archaeon]